MKNNTIYFGISKVIPIFVIQKERDKQPQSRTESEFKSIEKEKRSPVTPITKELEERETKEVPPPI